MDSTGSPGGLERLHILVGGPQGSGLETTAQVLTVAYAVLGYRVLASREYHSNIIGRHSYVTIAVDPSRVPGGFSYPAHVAGFMDAESVFTHYRDLGPGSILIYDEGLREARMSRIPSIEPETRKRLSREYRELGLGEDPPLGRVLDYMASRGVRLAGLDYRSLLGRLGERYRIPRPRLRRYLSAVVAGAVAGVAGLSPEELREGFLYRFAGRRPEVIEPNVYVAGLAAEEAVKRAGRLPPLPEPVEPPSRFLVVTGNEAVAIGKVAAGVRFQSYYPITPAQDESFYLEAHQYLGDATGQPGGVVVLQTEDELAAIAAAVGASLTGARAATATSGPGFDLMIEGLGWACINEAPVVVTLYQRGGPSTGLPTRGSQEDLLAALFAGHGECPRIVIASAGHAEALRDAVTAANLAERYQMPVVHLLDKFLANSVATLEPPDIEKLRIDRGRLLGEAPPGYRRFSLDEGPVSPRAVLGRAVMWYTGDEHDEYGHITEEPETRIAMVRKRMAKLELAAREIPEEPERARLIGDAAGALDALLIAWGTAASVAADALGALQRRGLRAAVLQIRYFSPFPAGFVSKAIRSAREAGAVVAAVEHNYQAQAARLVEMHTGLQVDARIVKYTGRPIHLHELVDAVRRVTRSGGGEVTLSYGA